MSNFLTNLNNNLRLLLSMSVADIADVLVVAVAVYAVISFLRRTNSARVAQGIFLLLIALGLSGLLKLSLTNFILRQVFEIGILAMVILFQPEIRRALERVGSYNGLLSLFGKPSGGQVMVSAIEETVNACMDMSASRTGALIVFERVNRLSSINLQDIGCEFDAQVHRELLKNLFYKGSPLHDGAVIIREGRVATAKSILYGTTRPNLSGDLGTRHRAGLGMSERTDAVVVIVSEETGSISVAIDGLLKRHLSADMLQKILEKELLPADMGGGKDDGRFARLWKKLTGTSGKAEQKKVMDDAETGKDGDR